MSETLKEDVSGWLLRSMVVIEGLTREMREEGVDLTGAESAEECAAGLRVALENEAFAEELVRRMEQMATKKTDESPQRFDVQICQENFVPRKIVWTPWNLIQWIEGRLLFLSHEEANDYIDTLAESRERAMSAGVLRGTG